MTFDIYKERQHPYSEPEWTAKNQNRKKGATTLKQCGWCEHRGSGSYRYNCGLATSCDLLKSYGIGDNVYWDTPCIINYLGKKDIDSILENKNYKIKSLKQQIESKKEEINTLTHLTFKDTPPLPNNRIHNYYNVDDVVYVYYENKWTKGVVVSGYRHHDGCVSYVLNDYPESKKGWGCGFAIPGILKEWEYKYFKKNLTHFEFWLAMCNREYNNKSYDMNDLYFALKNGR